MHRFYEDEGMNFAVLLSLGAAYSNLADVGEPLATIDRIPNGDIGPTTDLDIEQPLRRTGQLQVEHGWSCRDPAWLERNHL